MGKDHDPITGLTERELLIVALRCQVDDPMTFEEIARRLGVSRQYVHKTYHSAKERLIGEKDGYVKAYPKESSS